MKPEKNDVLARLLHKINWLLVSLMSWILGAGVFLVAVDIIVLTAIADVVPGVDLAYVNLGIDTWILLIFMWAPLRYFFEMADEFWDSPKDEPMDLDDIDYFKIPIYIALCVGASLKITFLSSYGPEYSRHASTAAYFLIGGALLAVTLRTDFKNLFKRSEKEGAKLTRKS